MSLILEALRKSEAERRRAQAPDLFAELPQSVQRRRHHLSTWHWLLLAVTLTALLAWLARERWSSSPVPAAATIADSQPPAARTAPDVAIIKAPSVPDATIAINGNNFATQTKPIAPIPPSTVSSPPDKTLQREPVSTATVVVPPPTTPVVAPPQAPVQATTTATPPTSKPADRDTDLLELSDLSAEQRRQLPPLKLSMHLWNQDPSRRLVIIDGARLAEGDRIGDAVIDQITTDSVVLDWNGRRLRLPLR